MTGNVLKKLLDFQKERDWGKFHTPENLAKSISIEAAELLECYQWDSQSRKDNVRFELADVLTYCYLLAARLDEDPEKLILEKLEVTAQKYPVNKFYGISTKYSETDK